MQNTNNQPSDYYQIQCADCGKTFVWRQAYWQSRTPGSRDAAGSDYVSRAFCPHCGAIVCEGIGSSYWKWYGDNQLINANNPLPPKLPPDLEWIPDDHRGEAFMEEFHRNWGVRRLPKDLQVPASQQRLDLSLVRDFREKPFRSKKAQSHPVRLAGLWEYLTRLLQRAKMEDKDLQEIQRPSIQISARVEAETDTHPIPQDINSESLPLSWFFASEKEREYLWNELQKEIPVGHVLFRVPLLIIATQNYVTDDILCKHLNEPDRYTVVHLTWSATTETIENLPAVEMDGSFEDFLNYANKMDMM